jgi:hypothetical protein
MAEGSAENGRERTHPPGGEPESLFERFPWLYAFCRDHLFRGDTELMGERSLARWRSGRREQPGRRQLRSRLLLLPPGRDLQPVTGGRNRPF